MEKVKIKLNVGEAEAISSQLLSMTENLICKDFKSQINLSVMREVAQVVLQIRIQCIGKKPKSKNITVSQALTFFALFYGYDWPIGSYTGMAFTTMCRQIEKQLFIKGEFILPQKGVFHG